MQQGDISVEGRDIEARARGESRQPPPEGAGSPRRLSPQRATEPASSRGSRRATPLGAPWLVASLPGGEREGGREGERGLRIPTPLTSLGLCPRLRRVG